MRNTELGDRSDQAETLRWLISGGDDGRQPEPNWLLVLSGRPSDDSRLASLALARALSRSGRRIGWVSLESHDSDHRQPISECSTPRRTRNRPVASPSGKGRMCEAERRDEREAMAGRSGWETIIADLGHEDDVGDHRLWQRCRAAVLVCRTEPESMRCVLERVERVTRQEGRAPLSLMVWENCAEEGARLGQRFDELTRLRLGQITTYLGSIPYAESSEGRTSRAGNLSPMLRDSAQEQAWMLAADRLARWTWQAGQTVVKANRTVRLFSETLSQTIGGR